MFNLAPYWIFRQFDNLGRLAAGARLHTYRAGTTTPHPTFQDAAGTINNTNPIVLSSSGSAVVFLDDIKYRFYLTDANGALIDDIDNIGAGGGGAGTGSFFICQNYNALRALTEDHDMIYVLGRDVAADGGQGIFLKSTSVADDNDAIILVRQSSTRYIRDFEETIDPQWAGVKYGGSVDQRASMDKAITLSGSYSMPLLVSGDVYLGTNLTVTGGAIIRLAGSFYGPGTPPTVTFASGSILDYCAPASISLPIVFAAGVISTIRSSYFAGDADTIFARISACTTTDINLIIDNVHSMGTSINIPVNFATSFDNDGRIRFTIGSLNLQIHNLIYNGFAQIFEYTDIAFINTVIFNGRRALPEWFGAVGDNTTNDAIAIQACVRNERVQLKDSSSYRVTQAIDCPTVVTFYGNLVAAMSTNAPINDVSDVPTPRLFLDPATSMDVLNFSVAGQLALVNVGLAMGGNAAVDAGVVNGTFNALGSVIYATNATGTIKSQHVAMSNSVINALTVFTASAVDLYLDNVRDDSNYARRKFAHDSSFRSVYLEEEAGESATFDNILTTRNADGLVEGKHTLHLESLTIQSIVTEAESLTGNTTYIEVEIYDNLGTQAYRVRRNGTQIAGSTSTPAYIQYDIRADDKPNIVVRYYGVTAGIPVYIVPKNKPSGSDVLRVISIENRVWVGKGDTSPSVTYNAYNVELNGDSSILTGNRMAVNGYYYGTKWCIG